MATTLPSIERILEPVTACLTPEVARRIVNVRMDDPLVMQRLELLREKANEGTLTELERSEYEGFIEGNDLLMLINGGVVPSSPTRVERSFHIFWARDRRGYAHWASYGKVAQYERSTRIAIRRRMLASAETL